MNLSLPAPRQASQVTPVPGIQVFRHLWLWAARWPHMGLLRSEQRGDPLSISAWKFLGFASGSLIILKHGDVWPVMCLSELLYTCVLLIKIWLSGLWERLPELWTFAKGWASPTAGIVRLQPCWGVYGISFETYCTVQIQPAFSFIPVKYWLTMFSLQLIVSTRYQNRKSTPSLFTCQTEGCIAKGGDGKY